MAMAKILPSDDMQKAAADMSSGAAVATMIGAPIAVDSVSDMIGKVKSNLRKKKTWASIIEKDPSFDNADTRELFEALFDLSPHMMKHRVTAIPALRQAQSYDLGGVPTQLAATLSKAESDKKKATGPGILSGVSKNILPAVGALTSMQRDARNEAFNREKFQHTQDQAYDRANADIRGGILR